MVQIRIDTFCKEINVKVAVSGTLRRIMISDITVRKSPKVRQRISMKIVFNLKKSIKMLLSFVHQNEVLVLQKNLIFLTNVIIYH
jgi:hypothetical protein